MRAPDQLLTFVRDALVAGRSRAEISAALTTAGWSTAETEAALSTFADSPFQPPVPRPRPYVSAREFFLYGLMFVSLGVVAWHIVALAFALIDKILEVELYFDYTASSIRWSIASLIVFFPLFIWLDRRSDAALQRDPGRQRSAVRKWFGYVTLFVASLGLLGDLITAIYSLLGGETELAFWLKCVVVAVVSGTILLYFRRDTLEDADGR